MPAGDTAFVHRQQPMLVNDAAFYNGPAEEPRRASGWRQCWYITLPLLRAVRARYGPVAVVHFDAHLDTWDSYFGSPISHGTPFRRASEEGLIDRTASIHVGVRGPQYSRGDLDDDARLGYAIVTSEEIEVDGVAAAIERIRDRVGEVPLYLTFDIDVLDPAFAPGTDIIVVVSG